MKVRASPKSGVVMELNRGETDFPSVPLPEIQLKRILVPVDFSACSRKALQYAASLVKQFHAEVMLLHVIEPPIYVEGTVVPATLDSTIRVATTRRLSEWREKIASLGTVQTSVRTVSPHHEIVRAADETNTDLIVLGTEGRSGLARMLIGSTAERVVRHAPCPVMVVREREHDFINEPEAAGEKPGRSKRSGDGRSPEEKRPRKVTTLRR